jgi:hypothetical protein
VEGTRIVRVSFSLNVVIYNKIMDLGHGSRCMRDWTCTIHTTHGAWCDAHGCMGVRNLDPRTQMRGRAEGVRASPTNAVPLI